MIMIMIMVMMIMIMVMVMIISGLKCGTSVFMNSLNNLDYFTGLLCIQ